MTTTRVTVAAIALWALACAAPTPARKPEAPPNAAGDVHVPVRLAATSGDGFLPLVKVRVADRDYVFVVDTGAPVNAISTAVATDLELQLGMEVTARGAAGKTQPAYFVQLPALRVGDYSLPPGPAFALDLAEVEVRAGFRIDGALGTPFFASAPVTFDFAAPALIVHASGDYSTPESAAVVELTLVPLSPPTIAVALAGRPPARFMVDTGQASPLSIEADYAAGAGWLANPDSLHVTEVAGAGGSAQEYLARIRTVDIGGFELTAVPTTIAQLGGEPEPSGRAGAVGSPLLARFRTTVDYPNRRLVLNPVPGTGGFAPSFGLVLEPGDGDVRIKKLMEGSSAHAAGLKSGDRVVRVDDVAIGAQLAHCRELLATRKRVQVHVSRNDELVEVSLTRRAFLATIPQ